MNVNFYEHIRKPLRKKSRKKLIITPKKRIKSLLEAGYNLDEIANATMEAIHVKRQRMDSLHASGWTGGGGSGPIDFLTGAFETTGSALKAMDVLGVGGAVVGVGADVTDQTKKLVMKSSKVIFDGVTAAMGSIASSNNSSSRSPPTLKKKSPGTPAC